MPIRWDRLKAATFSVTLEAQPSLGQPNWARGVHRHPPVVAPPVRRRRALGGVATLFRTPLVGPRDHVVGHPLGSRGIGKLSMCHMTSWCIPGASRYHNVPFSTQV